MGISFGEPNKFNHCTFKTNNDGICCRPTEYGRDRCKNHVGKKEVIKNPAKKFRGKSKVWDGFQGAEE